MVETKKVFKFWWPWQTAKIEAMLEEMAAQGWALARVRAACMSFVFEKCEPAKVRYCIDYQEKEKPEYLLLLSDAGWKKEYQTSGWYIWSKPYDMDKPELFTDIDSLIRRNNAILGMLTAVFAAQVPLMVVNMQNLAQKSLFSLFFLVLWLIIVAVLAGCVVGMAVGTERLKRRKAVGA